MCFGSLPEDYVYLDKIDLMHNKKQFWIVNGLSLAIMIVMIVAGYFIDHSWSDNSTEVIIAVVVMFVSYVLYIVLHELTHLIVMRISVKAKFNFGFNGWAAYAGSTGFFDKAHYIAIALAPLVVWGIVLSVLTVFFHTGIWFWVIWALQIGNVAGASGDLFCTYKMITYPKNILVRDTGTEMTVYRKKTEEELSAMQTVENFNDIDGGSEID